MHLHYVNWRTYLAHGLALYTGWYTITQGTLRSLIFGTLSNCMNVCVGVSTSHMVECTEVCAGWLCWVVMLVEMQ